MEVAGGSEETTMSAGHWDNQTREHGLGEATAGE